VTDETRQIADHLNELLKNAKPFRMYWPDGGRVGPMEDAGAKPFSHSRNAAKSLSDRLQPIIQAATEATDLIEIADAARERREADLIDPTYSSHNWANPCAHEHTARIWRACRQQIDAAIEADNAERAAAYERYRAACEQGIALLPSNG